MSRFQQALAAAALVASTIVPDIGVASVSVQQAHRAWVETWASAPSPGEGVCEVEIDSNDNIILHGNRVGTGTEDDYLTRRYTPNGTLLWTQRYDGSGHGSDWSSSFRFTGIDAADNIYVTGYTPASTGPYVAITIKYAPDGTEEWVRDYLSPNPSGRYTAFCVQVLNDGAVYVGGNATHVWGT